MPSFGSCMDQTIPAGTVSGEGMDETMSDIKTMIGKLMLRKEVPLIETDKAYRVLSCNDRLFKGEDFFQENRDLWELLTKKAEESLEPVLYLEAGCYAYSVIRDPSEERNYILGPVILGEVSRPELWSYRGISRFLSDRIVMNGMQYERFWGYICVLYFAIHRCWLDEKEFLRENGIREDTWEVKEHEKLLWQMDSSDSERNHYSYQMEQRWLDYVRRGEKVEGAPGTFSFDASIVGKMAKGSLKQKEYTCVCLITLLTRAVIEAGVPAMEAYNTSDMYLQKLERCRTQPEMQVVINNVNDAFLNLVRRVKAEADIPPYILICEDYIARHRTKNINIPELTEMAGVSHGYLVKKFKEYEGQTIKQYIIREKIRAAANMIKYSDATFAEIAEYLKFSSQSHMGKFFYREFGMTPKEYQRKYKVVEFSGTGTAKREKSD